MDISVAHTFTLSDLPALLALALLVMSYLLGSILWLRLCTLAGLIIGLGYLFANGAALGLLGLAGMAGLLVNLGQLFMLYVEQAKLRLPEKDATLLREALPGLEDTQIARLLKAAEWQDLVPGDVLTRQDVPVDALYFLCSGRANVEVNKSLVAYLEKGSFVGEIAYLTGNPATATVVIDEPGRVLSFSKMRLAKMVAADEHINGIIYQLLGRDLAQKMRRSNTRRVLTEGETP